MSAAAPPIAPATHMGAVHLTVSDLERSLDYYSRAIGLETLEHGAGRASLGAGGSELLVLVEEPGAQPARHHTGLFHVAYLLPDRPSLARWLAHAIRERIPLTGASDHFVSEAIYLQDPDDHGIEIYRDRPRDLWEGQVTRMGTEPLDLRDLLGELGDDEPDEFARQPDGTVVGHVHLQVADVPASIRFYRDVLGFGLMATYGGQAAFLSAGGYHHHLGANTWNSLGAEPAPPGAAALRHATIVLPDPAERDRLAARASDAGHEPEAVERGLLVRDPSGVALLLAG